MFTTNNNNSNNDNIDKMILSCINGEININLVIQWLSSTKTNKYNTTNDYQLFKENFNIPPITFSHYFIDTLKNHFVSYLENLNNNTTPNIVTQIKQPTQPNSFNEFPPLAATPNKTKPIKENSNNNINIFPNLNELSKTINLEIDNTVQIYSIILFNRIYPQSLLSELNWIIKSLATIQIDIYKNNTNTTTHNTTTHTTNTTNREINFFENTLWSISFFIKLLKSIQPLLLLFEPKFIISLAENKLLNHYESTFCKNLIDISNAQIQEYTNYSMIGSINNNKDKSNNSIKISSPFRMEMDFQKKLRKSEDAGILSNREKSLDQFYELIRLFQLDYKTSTSTSNQNQNHGNSHEFEHKTKEFFQLLHKSNIWWFCDLFIDQFIQCTTNVNDNNSIPTAPTPIATTPTTPLLKVPNLAETIASTMSLTPLKTTSSSFTPASFQTTQPTQPSSSSTSLTPSDQVKMSLLQKRLDTSPHKMQPPQQHYHHHHLHNQSIASSNKENLVNQQSNPSFTTRSPLKPTSYQKQQPPQQSSSTYTTPTKPQQLPPPTPLPPSTNEDQSSNYLNKSIQNLILKFSNKERFFINLILNHDSNTFYHHLQCSLLEKITMIQSCQCSNSAHQYYHHDYNERIVNLKRLCKMSSFIYHMPTVTYTSYNMSLLIPNFNEISKRSSNGLPLPMDLKSMLLSSIQFENISIYIPMVIEFLKLRDSISKENQQFNEIINILKNIYNLPNLLSTIDISTGGVSSNGVGGLDGNGGSNGTHQSLFTSLFIILELEQFFEEIQVNPHQFNHVSLPFKLNQQPSPSKVSTHLMTPTSPTKSTTPSNSITPPTTPTKSTPPSTPSTPSTPKPTNNTSNNTNNNNNNNNALLDNNSRIGYNILWSNSNNCNLMNDFKKLLNEPIEFLKLQQQQQQQLKLKLEQEKNNNDTKNTTTSTSSNTTATVKTLVPRRITPMNKKVITSNIGNDDLNDGEYSPYKESPLQHQLEWWYFWNHPSIARISNLLSETLLPFFSEMIFNLSVPIIINLSNEYIEASTTSSNSSISASDSLTNGIGIISTSSSSSGGNLLDSKRLQSLINSVFIQVKSSACKKVDSYCKENVKTLILLLLPNGLDDNVLNVGTSIISRHLNKLADSICTRQILQKVEILCIEIITRKQTISTSSSSSASSSSSGRNINVLSQLLTLSLSDINRLNSQPFTLSSIKSHHISSIDEIQNVKSICKLMEDHQLLLEPFINEIYLNIIVPTSSSSLTSSSSVFTLIQQQQNNLIDYKKSDLLNSAESIFIKLTEYIKNVLINSTKNNFDSTQFKKSLPTLFRLVSDIITNHLILINFYQYSKSIFDDITNGGDIDKSKDTTSATSTTTNTTTTNNIIFNIDFDSISTNTGINNFTNIIPINQNISNTFTKTTITIIKSFSEIQPEFMELLPNYLLPSTKIFSLISQTIQFIKNSGSDGGVEDSNNGSTGSEVDSKSNNSKDDIINDKIQNCFNWLHSFDWLFINLIQDNIITLVSLESSWINLFDRCITFIFEDVELQPQPPSQPPSQPQPQPSQPPGQQQTISEHHSNHLLIGASVLGSFLKYIIQFISFYQSYFKNYYKPSIESVDTTTTTTSTSTTKSPSLYIHIYDPMTFYLCVDSFLQRLIKFKNREKFRYNQSFINQIEKSKLYLEKSIQQLYPKFK